MLQRPHFLPKDKPRSVAQTAHCVRIILYLVKSLGGSPTIALLPLHLAVLKKASALPLAGAKTDAVDARPKTRQE